MTMLLYLLSIWANSVRFMYTNMLWHNIGHVTGMAISAYVAMRFDE